MLHIFRCIILIVIFQINFQIGKAQVTSERKKNVISYNPEKPSRFERKALKCEFKISIANERIANIKKEKTVNVKEIQKLERSKKKNREKAERYRYKDASKSHIRAQASNSKRMMRKSLKKHRLYKANRRHR